MSSGRRFAAARDAWRAVAARALDDDARVAGWGLVGSFGRGDADDWSDLDVLVIVEDADFAAYIDPTENELWSSADVFIDARRNAPDAAMSAGTIYIESGLPVGVDWYVYPRAIAAWPADCAVQRDGAGIQRVIEVFAEWNDRGPHSAPHHASPTVERRARLAMVPIAAKYITRGSERAAPLLASLNAECQTTDPAEMVAALDRLVDQIASSSPAHVVAAIRRYLAYVDQSIG